MSKYRYTEGMSEISGFGDGYEATCRAMVIAGLEWMDDNPEAKPEYKEYKDIYGITYDENEDAKKLQQAMLEASNNDCTGAMMQASLWHVMFANKNGWEKYTEQMLERAEDKT